jgi:hypothetical protein
MHGKSKSAVVVPFEPCALTDKVYNSAVRTRNKSKIDSYVVDD